MALRGVKVVELAGLAPAPFCGMILADFGARVIRVDRTKQKFSNDRLARGKESVAINLKDKDGVKILRKMCSGADVLIEPFRAGVMEKMGVGPDVLMKDNPKLIYARMTGFGQTGPLAKKAGHDINYIATSGVLSLLGRKGENPYAPVNLLADFAGGGLVCALGILMALFERSRSGQGQVIDANMVEGSAYVASWLFRSRDMPYWQSNRGENMLDGGAAFYETYKTKDGKYVSVGAIEPKFYSDLLKGLGLSEEEYSQLSDADQMKRKFTELFLTKTRDEWTEIFKDLDACFAPILSPDEAANHSHNRINNSFLWGHNGLCEPSPAPRLSRTPAVNQSLPQPIVGQHSLHILKETGFQDDEIQGFLKTGVVEDNSSSSKL
ncbi:hypothetical protein FSP39_022954 [Pinctada imbricata]|uniref:Alpha-methylacyl-CoA racemase n=1 Tax=Pinctada imbricata TaxID=66713 RepID=A0AA88YCJ5_PINIB|nr:hypothetical protein FSP39_022954 [Pinctada imbricata]